MAVGAVLFSSTQLLPQLLQTDFGYTATISGLALMPGGIAMLLVMPGTAIGMRLAQPKYVMAVGTLILSAALWHMTSLPPDASFNFFVRARVFQMVGLPLLFVPINTASYSNLPPEKTNQASALINVARNVGGSIGVSLAATEVARRSQFHQLRLTDHLVPSSVPYQEALQRAAAHLTAAGTSQADAQQQAVGIVGQSVQLQASLLSYVDVFFAFAILAMIMIPLALFILKTPPPAPRASRS